MRHSNKAMVDIVEKAKKDRNKLTHITDKSKLSTQTCLSIQIPQEKKNALTVTIADIVALLKRPTGMNTAIIAIDGHGGAGKSTFAELLSKKLDGCSILHTDDFATPENPLNWYKNVISQVLVPLRENCACKFQRYDWETNKLAEWVSVDPVTLLILEGVSSARREFRPYLSFSIFIDAGPETCLRRGLLRDGASEETWLEWRAEEVSHFSDHQTQDFVDIVISGELPFERAF